MIFIYATTSRSGMSSLFPGSKSLDTYLVLSSVRSKQTFDPRITHQANYGKRRPVLGLNGAHLMACKCTSLSRPCNYSYRFMLARAACRDILSILNSHIPKSDLPPGACQKKRLPSKKLTQVCRWHTSNSRLQVYQQTIPFRSGYTGRGFGVAAG